MEVYQNLIICRCLYRESIYQISGEYFKRFLSYHLDKQNPVFGHVQLLLNNKYFRYNRQNKTLSAISLALGLHKSRYCQERSVLFCKYK